MKSSRADALFATSISPHHSDITLITTSTVLAVGRDFTEKERKMELIDRDKLKEYIDNCECCEKCDKIGFMCNERCELPDCVTPQWERVLNEQQTVDAIPVQWLYDLAEQKEKASAMIKGVVALWHMEQEKQNESD